MWLKLESLNSTQKGALALVAGTLIILYAFNIMQRILNTAVIFGGIACIWYGLDQLGIIELVKNKFYKQ